MGKRGPQRTPTALLKLRGSWRAKTRKAEDRAEIAAPAPSTANNPSARPPNKIKKKWLKLFKTIPGYDPCVLAGDCDFDEKAAQKAIDFFPKRLKHVKGPMAGKPFVLEPLEQAIVACIFGWKRPDGLRRYRTIWLYVAKKYGKSAFVAGLILLVLTEDHEKGAEIYSAASSKDQASLIFSHASGMVKQDEGMAGTLRIYGDKGGSVQRSIVYEDEMSAYRCLAADSNTADGANVHMAAIDEVHRHKTPDLADVLEKSTAARTQPLIFYTTTADYNRPSLCNTKLKYAREVRDNPGDPAKPGHDPTFLPIICEASKDDDWESEDTWRKANPNLGVTVSLDYMRQQVQRAKDIPSELNSFLRLCLNIVTNADEAWLDIAAWDACEGAIVPADLAGRPCYAGLDLSSTTDLSAFVLYFPDTHALLPFFWIPGDNAHKRERLDKVPYLTWERQGLIETTPGNVIDYDRIRAKINELGDSYNIKEIAIDRWGATQITTQLEGDGFTMIPFGQGYASMAAPAKEFEKLILEGALCHGGNAVMRWMAGNVTAEMDAAGNIKPSKAKSTERVDGVFGAVMAIGLAIVRKEKRSVYEDRGVVMV